MVGQGLDSSPGDIRQVLASNRKPLKNPSRKANEGNTVPYSTSRRENISSE
jgi:hypothetical protein